MDGHRITGTTAARLAAVLLAASLLLALPALAGAGSGQDGRYKGHGVRTGGGANAVDIKFRVTGGGAKIKRWRVLMFVPCGIGGVVHIKQPMPTMKVTRRGRFRKVLRYRDGSIRGRVEVSGSLKGKRVKRGKLRYKVGTCERGHTGRPIRWRAHRV